MGAHSATLFLDHAREPEQVVGDLAEVISVLEPKIRGAVGLSLTHLQKGEFEEAIAILEQMPAETGDHPSLEYHLALLFLGMLYESASRFAYAQRVYLTLVDSPHANIVAMACLGVAELAGASLVAALKAGDVPRAAERFREAEGWYRNTLRRKECLLPSRVAEAEFGYGKACFEFSGYSKHGPVLLERAAGRLDRALDLREASTDVASRAALYLGWLHESRACPGDARECYLEVLNLGASDYVSVSASWALVLLCAVAGEVVEAEKHSETVLQRGLQWPWLPIASVTVVGMLYEKKERFADAAAQYEKTVSLVQEETSARERVWAEHPEEARELGEPWLKQRRENELYTVGRLDALHRQMDLPGEPPPTSDLVGLATHRLGIVNRRCAEELDLTDSAREPRLEAPNPPLVEPEKLRQAILTDAASLNAERPNGLKAVRAAFIAEERAAILAALEKHDWVQRHAARELGALFGSFTSAMKRHPDLVALAKRRARPGRPAKKKR